MGKYIEELKKVTWPEGKEVNKQFWITLAGIILLIIFFIVTDGLISKVFEHIYK